MKYIILLLLILSLSLFPQEKKIPGAAGIHYLDLTLFTDIEDTTMNSDSEKEDEDIRMDISIVQNLPSTTTTTIVATNPPKTEETPKTQTSKPSSNKPANNNAGNTEESSSPVTQLVHTHSWEPLIKEVYHEELGHYESVLIKESWTEEVPIYEEELRDICSGCGEDITNSYLDHIRQAMKNGNMSCSGHHSELVTVQVDTEVIIHEAEYESVWVVDKAAYTEKEIIGYQCSCGETK